MRITSQGLGRGGGWAGVAVVAVGDSGPGAEVGTADDAEEGENGGECCAAGKGAEGAWGQPAARRTHLLVPIGVGARSQEPRDLGRGSGDVILHSPINAWPPTLQRMGEQGRPMPW